MAIATAAHRIDVDSAVYQDRAAFKCECLHSANGGAAAQSLRRSAASGGELEVGIAGNIERSGCEVINLPIAGDRIAPVSSRRQGKAAPRDGEEGHIGVDAGDVASGVKGIVEPRMIDDRIAARLDSHALRVAAYSSALENKGRRAKR